MWYFPVFFPGVVPGCAAVDKAEAWAGGEETPGSRARGQEVNTWTTLCSNIGPEEELVQEEVMVEEEKEQEVEEGVVEEVEEEEKKHEVEEGWMMRRRWRRC